MGVRASVFDAGEVHVSNELARRIRDALTRVAGERRLAVTGSCDRDGGQMSLAVWRNRRQIVSVSYWGYLGLLSVCGSACNERVGRFVVVPMEIGREHYDFRKPPGERTIIPEKEKKFLLLDTATGETWQYEAQTVIGTAGRFDQKGWVHSGGLNAPWVPSSKWDGLPPLIAEEAKKRATIEVKAAGAVVEPVPILKERPSDSLFASP
jgi:hypothetical protein